MLRFVVFLFYVFVLSPNSHGRNNLCSLVS